MTKKHAHIWQLANFKVSQSTVLTDHPRKNRRWLNIKNNQQKINLEYTN